MCLPITKSCWRLYQKVDDFIIFLTSFSSSLTFFSKTSLRCSFGLIVTESFWVTHPVGRRSWTRPNARCTWPMMSGPGCCHYLVIWSPYDNLRRKSWFLWRERAEQKVMKLVLLQVAGYSLKAILRDFLYFYEGANKVFYLVVLKSNRLGVRSITCHFL